MEKIWLKQSGRRPAEIDVAQYSSLVALLDESFQRYADRTAYLFMGKAITFRGLRAHSPRGCRHKASSRAIGSP